MQDLTLNFFTAVFPNNRESRNAISGLTARRSLNNSFTV
jgi:hypothetical protein